MERNQQTNRLDYRELLTSASKGSKKQSAKHIERSNRLSYYEGFSVDIARPILNSYKHL